MSDLGFLEKLLDGAEVDWMPLGTVTAYEQPTKYLVKSKNYDDRFSTPVLTAGKTFVLGYTDETSGIYEASKSPTIIFDDFTTANKWVDFDFKAKSSAMKMITSSDEDRFLIKYIYHWLNTIPSGLVEGDHKRQWISNYSSKTIPIPCPDDPEKSLAIQGEIVRILDSFTELTAELTAELELRKEQYKHFRDQLLNFEEGEVEWKLLGEVCDFTNAKPHEKFVVPDGDIALMTSKFVATQGQSARYIDRKSVLTPAFEEDVALVMSDLPNGRALAKAFFVRENDRYAANQRVCILRSKDKAHLLPRFLFYVIDRNPQLLRYDSGYDQTHLKKGWILDVILPVPPLAEQARIVEILDKFDKLTTSLSEGLPREIELRQKQYEYYRDLLLSFPKPAEAVEA